MKPRPMPAQRVDELYRRYGPTIYSRCRRLLRDASFAEDATQEVFLRVLRHIESVPEDAAALAWIHRVSTNYCLNLLRDSARHAEPMESLPEQEVDTFEDSVVAKDLTEKLMGSAPPELRAPVALYHVKGMEQAQVARALGVSRRTVIYRLGDFTERARKFVARAEAGLA